MEVVVPCKYGKDPIENSGDNAWTTFCPYSLWELYVVIATRVLIQSASKPNASNALPQ